MNAAVLYHEHKPLQIKELEIPSLLEGQVLVKVFYSGVCRSQVMEARGLRGNDPWLPHLLGHEGTGEVIAIGVGVTKVRIGDQVILGWISGEGIDARGATYTCDGNIVHAGSITTFSNYSVVSENRIVHLPKGIPHNIGVLFGCALLTGAGIVFNELKPKQNEAIIVLGLGGVGLSALMALQSIKHSILICIDISDEKLAFAKTLGATHVMNSKKMDICEEVKKILPHGVDTAIESAGTVETIELAFSLIRKNGGRLYFASHPKHGAKIQIDPYELICGKQIFGSWGGSSIPDRDIPKLAKNYLDKSFPLYKLIPKTYSLTQINEALEDLWQGKVFRPLIKMTHEQ